MTNISQAMRQPPPSAALYQELLPPQVRKRAKDFFGYGTDFTPLAAAGTLSQDIAIQNDSDFLLVTASAIVTDVLNTTFTATNAAPFLVQISDSGSGRNLFNRAVHFSAVFGDAQLPAWFPFPKLLDRASTLRVTLQNLDGANAFNVRVLFEGIKVFDTNMGQA